MYKKKFYNIVIQNENLTYSKNHCCYTNKHLTFRVTAILVIQFQPYDLLGNYIVSLYKIGSQYYMYSSRFY
jgi:hypothetical protein